MKIALFTDTYLPQTNGVVAFLCDVIGVLSREHEIVLFAPGEGRFRIERVSANFRICWVPSRPFPFYEGYRIASMNFPRIAKLIEREDFDIIHAHAPINLGLQGMMAGKGRGIPVVATYHTHYPDYVPHLLSGRLPGVLNDWGKHTAKGFVRHLFGMADIVTAPTHELVKELRSYGLRKVEYLPNGIDLGKLRCSARDVAAFRKAHGIPRGKKTVIYLGRLSFEKRVDRLLEAFRMIEDDDKFLIVAGLGPYQKNFREFARSIGIRNVVFTGRVKHPAVAYKSAQVFASASDSETFGLTFVEAMHIGLPAVGVRRLGAKEVVTDKLDGILVEPGDTAAFAKAMERLLDQPELRGRMAAEGRKTAKRYSIQRSAGETLAIYEGLLRRQRGCG
ncbi:glycosyltransferase [Candidatus Micrarchaeota archaeon]|nr:glycosyltransferase [Candidatus Micrarchaeota archaeon]